MWVELDFCSCWLVLAFEIIHVSCQASELVHWGDLHIFFLIFHAS